MIAPFVHKYSTSQATDKPIAHAAKANLFSDKRPRHPPGYWTRREGTMMRNFFDEFAKKRNINPSHRSEWRAVKHEEIIQAGGRSILAHFRNSHLKAVSVLYPETGSCEKQSLRDKSSQRKFLSSLAILVGFDPTIANNWYGMSHRDIFDAGGRRILNRYGGYVRALISLFPEHKLRKDYFTDDWHVVKCRRDFFDNYAAARKFDPLVANNWFGISRLDISEAGGRVVLLYHNNSLSKALADLYPELQLSPEVYKMGKLFTKFKKQNDTILRSKLWGNSNTTA